QILCRSTFTHFPYATVFRSYGLAIRFAMAPRNGASDCTGVAAGPPSAAAARGRVYGAKLALAAASARIGLHPSGVPAMGVPRSEHPDLAGVVSRKPEVHSGDLVFAGTRVLVQTQIDYRERGDPPEQSLEDF